MNWFRNLMLAVLGLAAAALIEAPLASATGGAVSLLAAQPAYADDDDDDGRRRRVNRPGYRGDGAQGPRAGQPRRSYNNDDDDDDGRRRGRNRGQGRGDDDDD